MDTKHWAALAAGWALIGVVLYGKVYSIAFTPAGAAVIPNAPLHWILVMLILTFIVVYSWSQKGVR